MATVSTLAGTIWKMHDTISNPGYTVYAVNFTLNSTAYGYLQPGVNNSSFDTFMRVGLASEGTTTTVWAYKYSTDTEITWLINDKEIQFLSGDDIANTSLIAWVEANADQVQAEYKVTVKVDTNKMGYEAVSRIKKDGTALITIRANEGSASAGVPIYLNPVTITVTGASYTYNRASGEIVLSSPVSDVVVTVNALTAPLTDLSYTHWRMNEHTYWPTAWSMNSIYLTNEPFSMSSTGVATGQSYSISSSSIVLSQSQRMFNNSTPSMYSASATNQWMYMNSSAGSVAINQPLLVFESDWAQNRRFVQWMFYNAIFIGYGQTTYDLRNLNLSPGDYSIGVRSISKLAPSSELSYEEFVQGKDGTHTVYYISEGWSVSDQELYIIGSDCSRIAVSLSSTSSLTYNNVGALWFHNIDDPFYLVIDGELVHEGWADDYFLLVDGNLSIRYEGTAYYNITHVE